jgi:ubiquitin C-terminal hydrolase
MDLVLFSKKKLKNEFSLEGKLGLINYGDSSFINAIIQAISNTEPLCFILRYDESMSQMWL